MWQIWCAWSGDSVDVLLIVVTSDFLTTHSPLLQETLCPPLGHQDPSDPMQKKYIAVSPD